MERIWHPGWSGWFTWGGYRGRLSYLGAPILVGLLVGVAVAALGALAGLGAGAGSKALAIAAMAGMALVVGAGLVAFVCILAQRMRDIGMPVVPCLLAYGAASLVVAAGVAVQDTATTAALWNADYPVWLNLLQLGLTVFGLALLIVPGNAWLDED